MSMEKQDIHGVVLLDKPTGMSSNKALQQVKHHLHARKAGHTGSLDPLATGLLPICLGQATKVSEYLLHSHKRYSTVIRLGQSTDTLDSDGEITRERAVSISDVDLENALVHFRGDIEQIPPMYSALKKNGQPLYKLARQGQEIERPARKMTVYELTAQRLDDLHVHLNVHCSSGFYIRSLAHDLGEALGCGAHVVELRRTAIKKITVAQAVALEDFLALDEPLSMVQPIDCLLAEMPVYDLDSKQVEDLSHGRKSPVKGLQGSGLGRFYRPDGSFLGVGEFAEQNRIKMVKLIVT